MKNVISAMFFLLASFSFAQKTERNSSSNYERKTIVLKVKDKYRADCKTDAILNSRLEYVFNKIGVNSIKKEFPLHIKPPRAKHANGMAVTDLSLIYKLKYSSNKDPWLIIPKLLKTRMFEYAEPSFTVKFLYTSNDPQLADLYFLNTIKAYQAWDVTTGDTNVVIGISDTGFDIDHPDLVDNVKYNYLDPINGDDDDGDGKIDNFRGWDLGEDDADPSVGSSWHGIFVAGIAGASTDNGNGLAGVGFKCKLLPIKITNANGDLIAAYPSIIYAADHGCSVVNCSWGSVNSWSQYGQDIVRYATVDRNCLVVASAGNDNKTDKFYPASFDWVMSVGGTDTLNQKWVQSGTEGSNYNENVDIVAPSVAITRIKNGGGTIIGGGRGTSFASPMVSGAAALVKSQFPSYSAIQVMEQLKATADDLSGIPFNSSYDGKMGEGLLNIYKAVTETSNPGFYMDEIVFTDAQDGLFTNGETVYIYGNLFNVLASSSSSSKMMISTTSEYVEWIDSVRVFGTLASGDTVSTIGIPFSFKIKQGTPPMEIVEFKIVFEDGSYDTKQVISTTLNVDYITFNINDLGFTIGSSGKLGYNVIGEKKQGVGLQISGSETVLYQMGLIAAVDVTKSSFVLDGDWKANGDLSYLYPGVESDLDISNSINDNPALLNSIGLKINQKTLVWKDGDRRKFIIIEYNIINTSGAPISGLNVGLFTDWDINVPANNIAVYDSIIKTGYAYEPTGKYAGVHILSDSSIQHYAFDNNGANGSVENSEDFTASEQYTSISGGNSRDSAGIGDVSQVVGVGPINIPTGDSVTIAFSIVAGANLAELKTQSLKSDTVYKGIRLMELTASHNVALLCKDSCSGEAGVQATAGIAPYSFIWNDALAQSTDTAIGLCAGSYICTVTDAIGNISDITIVITEPSELSIDFTDTIMDTGGCSAEINGSISGGTAPYLISWEDDPSRDSIHAVNICSGSYKVVVEDLNNCVFKDTININLITGSNYLETNLGVTLFPNPTINSVTINNLQLEGVVSISIYDEGGRRVIFKIINNIKNLYVELNHLSAGCYNVAVVYENKKQNLNLIILK